MSERTLTMLAVELVEQLRAISAGSERDLTARLNAVATDWLREQLSEIVEAAGYGSAPPIERLRALLDITGADDADALVLCMRELRRERDNLVHRNAVLEQRDMNRG